MADLMSQISQLDQNYTSSPSPDAYKQRLVLQAEFDNLIHGTFTSSSNSKNKHTGTTIGPQLILYMINSKTSTVTCTPLRIKMGCQNYSFFRNLAIPSLDAASALSIEQPIMLEEISRAMCAMQTKSPGPDGYPVEFYE